MRDFRLGGPAGDDQPKSKFHSLPIGPRMAEHSISQFPSALDELRLVQQCESLERCVGTLPAQDTRLSRRRIQQLHRGRRNLPFPIGIETAPEQTRALTLVVALGILRVVRDMLP